MAATAAKGIRVLPILEWTPHWASTRTDSSSLWAPPRNLYRPLDDGNFWARFVFEAIRRYGPVGTFWVAHPEYDSGRLAIRDWEVWNEPNSVTDGWVTPDIGHGYSVPRTPVDTVALQESLYARLCDIAVEAAQRTGTDARILVGGIWRMLDSLPGEYDSVRKIAGVNWLEAHLSPSPAYRDGWRLSPPLSVWRGQRRTGHGRFRPRLGHNPPGNAGTRRS